MNTMRLKGKIAEAGFSQARLAKEIGMCVSTLSNKMVGRSDFTLDEAQRICDVLGIMNADEKVSIFLPACPNNGTMTI